MLTTSVNTGKRFLVKQNAEIMPARHLFHYIHKQLIVVNRQITFLKYRRTLKLIWCNLVVTGFDRNTEPEGFDFKIAHKRSCPVRNRSEIMVFQLLPFGMS